MQTITIHQYDPPELGDDTEAECAFMVRSFGVELTSTRARIDGTWQAADLPDAMVDRMEDEAITEARFTGAFNV